MRVAKCHTVALAHELLGLIVVAVAAAAAAMCSLALASHAAEGGAVTRVQWRLEQGAEEGGRRQG